jgi:hypothetical protein
LLEIDNVIATRRCADTSAKSSRASKMIGAYHCLADATA